MAVVCIAGTSAGIGKTAVAEFLLGRLPGWHAARVRVADEMPEGEQALVGEPGYRLTKPSVPGCADTEAGRLLAAGARSATLLMAEPRGLEAGLRALLARFPPGANVFVEGNAYLWAREADVSIMVIGPGPTGKGLGRVRPSVRELFQKIDIWAWNTRRDPAAEGFFDFPLALGRMGFREVVSNRAEYHHVNPREDTHAGNAPFAEAMCQALERRRWRGPSDEFLRRAGFDV